MNILYKNYKIIWTCFIIIFCTSCSDKTSNSINSSEWGLQATDSSLDPLMETFLKPPLSQTGQSLLTANKMGFDVLDHSKFKTNWLLDEFYAFVKDQKRTILDVGCGYGTLSLNVLLGENIVIVNDISRDHLIEVRRRAISSKLPLSHLYLNNKSFPHDLELSSSGLDVVMLHRVLHFLSPQEIEEGLKKIHQWLKPGGKVFVVVMAPQHKGFSKWFLPLYNEKWNSGDKWPGVNLPVSKALPDQAYNLPEYLHVMDERPLLYVFEKYGFEVEKADFIDMKPFGKKEEQRDGHEAVGVIAVKK